MVQYSRSVLGDIGTTSSGMLLSALLHRSWMMEATAAKVLNLTITAYLGLSCEGTLSQPNFSLDYQETKVDLVNNLRHNLW